MPLIRSLASKRRALLTASISLDGKIISPYLCYIKKGLVYIAIIFPFSYQPFSCSKYTKANTYSLYNIQSVAFNKYKSLYYTRRYIY